MKKTVTFFAILSFLSPIYSIEPEYFVITGAKEAARVFSTCTTGDFEKAREMINKLVKNGSINDLNRLFPIQHQKITLLMFAITVGEHRFVDYLLEKGVAVDTKTNQNETALFFAIAYNHPQIVSMLLKAGAAKDIKNKAQKTPLESAQEKKNALVFANFKATSAKEKKKTEQALRKIDSIISLLEQDKTNQ